MVAQNTKTRYQPENRSETIARDAIFSVLAGMETWHSSETDKQLDVISKYEEAVAFAIRKAKARKTELLESEKLAVSALYDLDRTFTQEGTHLVSSPQEVYREDMRLGGENIENALQRAINPDW